MDSIIKVTEFSAIRSVELPAFADGLSFAAQHSSQLKAEFPGLKEYYRNKDAAAARLRKIDRAAASGVLAEVFAMDDPIGVGTAVMSTPTYDVGNIWERTELAYWHIDMPDDRAFKVGRAIIRSLADGSRKPFHQARELLMSVRQGDTVKQTVCHSLGFTAVSRPDGRTIWLGDRDRVLQHI